MGLLSTLKAKLTGKIETPDKKQIVITPETYNVSTNMSASLEKSLIYWHLRGKINDEFVRSKINQDDADKILEQIQKLKE